MKKVLLSLAVIATGFMAHSQVICAGISPGAIAGNYNFTWADPGGGDWSTPDFLIPGTYVEDTLAMVEDGTAGTNPDGNPFSQEGCNTLTNGASVNGKIAVCYRGTCEFGEKALNAQNEGAVALIVINRDPESVGMGGGAQGTNVTIPVVMLSSTDGATLVQQMQTDDVVMLIGNKTGLYNDDAGLTKATSLISQRTGVPSQLAQNGTEFNFDLGTRVYNYGQNDQNNMTLTANIDGPGGNVYNEMVTLPNIASGDSLDVEPAQTLNFSQFSLATYPAGRYTLTYTLGLDAITDEYDADNTITAEFVVQDSIFAFAHLDQTTNHPVQTNGFRPSTNNATFSNCIVYDDPNGSRLMVEGLYFQALGNNVDLSGEEIAMYVYEWQDVFTDLNDAALAFNNLQLLGSGFYYYPSDLQGQTVYGALDAPVGFADNQRYLLCAQTVNLEVFLGFDDNVDYTWNSNYYLQPFGPIENDGSYFAAGFGFDVVSAVGAKVADNTAGIEEVGTVNGTAYPNPATDVVKVSLETTESGTLTVTDLAGKVVQTEQVSFATGMTDVNIATLEPGVYIFSVTLDNGQTSQFNIVKK